MNRIMISAIAIMAITGSAYAADLTGSASVDFTRSGNNAIANPKVELAFTDQSGVFGGLRLNGNATGNGNVSLDKWNLGYKAGMTTVSVGRQDDLFDFGKFEVVGGESLAQVNEDQVSVKVSYGNLEGLVGVDGDQVANAQLAYGQNLGNFYVTGTVDRNFVTNTNTLGLGAITQVSEKTTLAMNVTYQDDLAYQASVGYDQFAVFVNGDENEAVQNIGGGFSTNWQGADLYAEASYNLDTEEVTPAVGLKLSF